MPEIISKVLATITGTEPSDAPNGGFTAVLSTPSLDRDGDELQRDEWAEPLPEHITLDLDHLMTVQGTIGSAHPYFDADGRLLIDAQFASTPQAQEARSLVQEGHVRAVSVAFLNDKTHKSGKPRRELLNAGLVSVPSNRDAIILSSKAFDAVEHLKAVTAPNGAGVSAPGPGDLVQAIHNLAALLGAGCATSEPEDDETGESEGANKAVDETDAFMNTIDIIIKASGDDTGSPQVEPAETPAASEAAPQGPAEEPAAVKAVDDSEVELRARLMRASLLSAELLLTD